MIDYLKDLLLNFIGDYSPVIYGDNFAIDVPWVCACFLFLLCVYSIFRAIGGILKNA